MQKNKEQKNYISSYASYSKGLVEMVYNKEENKTEFKTYINGEVKEFSDVKINGQTYFPFPPTNNLLKSGTVLFPSDVCEYGSEKELIEGIQQFIHKYLGISSFFEKIATFYVLFTWIYDCFNELPYLRAMGDYGCGKSRFLKTIGSLCYKPMFTAGATTISPIFRIIDTFKGTLVLDEADLRISDTTSEIVKILNCGFSKGVPVLRSEEKRGGGYNPVSFDVYCPKIIATREKFYDRALESRFLIEEMDSSNLRDDIVINLPDNFEDEATQIRNKLLMWRFKNYGKKKINYSLMDKSLEPRLNQIILPLMTIIQDQDLRQELNFFISEYNNQLKQDRGFTWESDILEAFLTIKSAGYNPIAIKHLTDTYNAKMSEHEKKVTPKKVGRIVREKLKLRTFRTRDGYVVDIIENEEKIAKLIKKYDIYQEEDKTELSNVNV